MGLTFRRRQLALAVAAATASPLASRTFAATAEVRGTWVTTTGLTTGTVATPTATQTNFKKLHDIGLNSVYMDAWRAGYTYYSSPTLQAIVGTDHAPEVGTRDLLQETLIQSHRNGMAQISWFQYGFATFFGNPGASANPLTNYAQSHGWLLQDSAGNYTNSSNSFSWMNPLRPEVQQFVTGIVTDAVKKYDLDGVQFDDRIAWPVQFGYDAYTKAQYLSETGQTVPANYADSNFKSWRSGKLTAFTQQLQAAVKAVNPNIIFSVAPEVYPASYDDYLVNWPAWRTSGMLDEFVPQVYRRNATDFDSAWDGAGATTTGGQVQFMGPRRSDFAAGMAIDGSGWTAPFNPDGIQQEITQVRGTTGVAGHVLWYSNGVLKTYPNELTSFYDVANQGPAARPDQAAGWRPTSTVATSGGTNLWNIDVTTPGLYSIIYQAGGVWSIFDTRTLPAGTTSVPLTGASAVEIIADRRPASLFSMSSWNVDANGNAASASNWSYGVVPPAAADTTLRFGYVITAGRTVALDTTLTAGSLIFDDATGYTLTGGSPITLDVTTGASAVTVSSGSHTIAAPLALSDNTTFAVPSGSTLTASNLSSPSGITITKTGTGTLAVNRLRNGTLSVTGGSVKILPDGSAAGVSRINAISLAAGTKLDLSDNKLVTPAAIGSWNGSAYSGVTAMIKSGRNGGAWNGNGIVTSQSTATSSTLTTLGIATAAQVEGIGNTETAVWAGQTVTGSDTLVMYTYGGDANLDGKINIDDYTRIDFNVTLGVAGYFNGDFNYDGKINVDDYTIIDFNIPIQGAPFSTASSELSAIAIPEPTAPLAMIAASLAMRRRRRAKHPVIAQ